MSCVTHHHACDCREARFAELEAENARLKDSLAASERACHVFAAGEATFKRERDEARAQRDALTDADGLPLHWRDLRDARAACAAMRQAVTGALEYAPPCVFCHAEDDEVEAEGEVPHSEDCICWKLERGTAGFELLPSIQMLDEVVKENAQLTDANERLNQPMPPDGFCRGDFEHLKRERDEAREGLEISKKEHAITSRLLAEMRGQTEGRASIHLLDEVVKENARLTQLEIPQLKARLDTQFREIETLNKILTDTQARLENVQATAEQEESKLRGVNREMSARLEKADVFKVYVHKRLDDAGVPGDPEAENNAKHGCRIEGRLNYVLARLEKAERPVICTGCSKAITADDPMPDCATCSAEEFEEMVAQLKKVQATAEQEESKLRGVNREMSARLEKAEANYKTLLDERREQVKGLHFQLEAMRAALEAIKEWFEGAIVTGNMTAQNTVFRHVSAALLPSAPRLYRNAVLEEAAKACDQAYEDECDGEDYARSVRALKTEDGT